MRYGVAIPHANRFASASALDRMAAIVEDLGFDSIWTSDHIIVPEGSGYIPEHMLEPLAALSHLAARTSHVTLGDQRARGPLSRSGVHREVPVEPRRDQRRTTGARRRHRLARGGVPTRSARRSRSAAPRPTSTSRSCATSGRPRRPRSTGSGSSTTTCGCSRRPRPSGAGPSRSGSVATPGPRIAAPPKLGDGWHPINMSPSELADGVVAYRAACEAAGRAAGPSLPAPHAGPARRTISERVLTGTPDEQASDIRAYAEAGLDELMLSMPWRSLDDLASSLRAFMRDVVPASDRARDWAVAATCRASAQSRPGFSRGAS